MLSKMRADIEGVMGAVFPMWSLDRVDDLRRRRFTNAGVRLGTAAEACEFLAALQRLPVGPDLAVERMIIASMSADLSRRDGDLSDVLGAPSDVSYITQPGFEIHDDGDWRYGLYETPRSRTSAVFFRGRVVAGFRQMALRHEICGGDEII